MRSFLRSRFRVRSAFAIVGRPVAYRQLAYAFTILPLGLFYAALLAIGALVGIVLVPVVVGIPILAGNVAAWWWLGDLERRLAGWWLGIDLRPLDRPSAGHGRRWLHWWRVASAYLGSHQTWMTLGHLLLKVPLGLLSFVVFGGLVLLAGALVVVPVPLALSITEGGITPASAALGAGALLASGWVTWSAALLTWVVTLHAAGAVAWGSSALTRLLLGQGDTTQRLEEAAATVERAEARADRAERSRQELIVNVGHELRTPTATIRGHVESLLLGLESAPGEGEGAPAGAPSADTLRHHLGIVQRETHRLGALIDELLTLARADSGELSLDITPVPPDEVVEEVYQSVAQLARRERQITVTRGVEREVPTALADRQRLVQVLLNLVRNAVAYTPDGGIVAVTAEPADPGRVAFSVVDTGVGIAPEDLPHVFDRFYRADPSRSRASGGFGLGLAIVRDLVKAMGGSVEVESAVGEGTRFRVLLPTAA